MNTSIKQTPKVGWIISNDYSVASSRLQGFLIHEYFHKKGYNSKIICSNFENLYKNYSFSFLKLIKIILNDQYDIIFFTRPNWMMFKMSEYLRLNNIKTIAIRCDFLPGEYDNYFNITLTPTKSLQEHLNIKSYEIIDDMIEVPDNTFKNNYLASSDKLNIVWVGHGGYGKFIKNFSQELLAHKNLYKKINIITISSGAWATHIWSLKTVYNHILSADIAIIPIPKEKEFQIKSTNRLTMFMALGMPVIVSPIKSYTDIVTHGENCFLANSIDEFAASIKRLEAEPLRKQLGTTGREFAIQNYHKKIIGSQWIGLIEKLYTNKNPSKPKSKLHTKLLSNIISM